MSNQEHRIGRESADEIRLVIYVKEDSIDWDDDAQAAKIDDVRIAMDTGLAAVQAHVRESWPDLDVRFEVDGDGVPLQ
jgi:hypothetical protein